MLERLIEIHWIRPWLSLKAVYNTLRGHKEGWLAHTTFRQSPSGHCYHMAHGQSVGTTRLIQHRQGLKGPWHLKSQSPWPPVSSSSPQTGPQVLVCRGEALEGALERHKTLLSGIQYRKHIKTCLHGTAVYNYCSLWDIPPLLPPILL